MRKVRSPVNRKGALVVTVVQIGYRIDMHIQREICRYTLWLQGELPEDFLVIHLYTFRGTHFLYV